MYLRRIRVRNIKCFSHIELSFLAEGGKSVRRWTALLGENGLGKSTLLQAMAAVLAGPGATRELLPVAEGWVREGSDYGEIDADLAWTEGDSQVEGWPKKSPYTCRYLVSGADVDRLPRELTDSPTVPAIVDWAGKGTSRQRETITKSMNRLKRTAYAEGKTGWLACGYGPFRRLSGGSQDADRILYSGRKSARFVTLFREDAALTNATDWLLELHNTARDGDPTSTAALERVKQLFATDFLPQPASLWVDARSARLELGNRGAIPFRHLSDGYRSMLALGIDLLRWMIAAFPDRSDPTNAHGVVLIDELDAHLHPLWQQQIGRWLLSRFPHLQFIVASHSPFLAQVAEEPAGNVLLVSEEGGAGIRKDRQAVNTWRADQILTEIFGLKSTRDPGVEKKIRQFLELKAQQRQRPLRSDESKQLSLLEPFVEAIPPSIEDPEERALAAATREALGRQRDALRHLR